MTPVLHTRRLTLRPPCPGDAERIATHLNNFAVAGNLSRVPYPYFVEDAAAWLKTRTCELPPAETEFSIDLGDHEMIGAIGFHRNGEGRPILGYYLGQPYWGRGIMTEAARAIIDWFFTATDEPILFSGAFAFNKPSLMVQNKLGFNETGRSMLHCLARNEQVRHIDTELTRDAWTGTVR